jgi:hypothetical protein
MAEFGAPRAKGFYHLEVSVRLDQFETLDSLFASTRPNLKGYDRYSCALAAYLRNRGRDNHGRGEKVSLPK